MKFPVAATIKNVLFISYIHTSIVFFLLLATTHVCEAKIEIAAFIFLFLGGSRGRLVPERGQSCRLQDVNCIAQELLMPVLAVDARQRKELLGSVHCTRVPDVLLSLSL